MPRYQYPSGPYTAARKYGRALTPTTPLSFDRVMEGRPPTSKALLFKFPYEILSEILQYIDRPSLASLALVNRDCRQWARSSQFCDITLDYSNNNWRLLIELLFEHGQRCVNHGVTTGPSLGACIQQITLRPDPRVDQENKEQLIEQGWLASEDYDPPEPLNEKFVETYDSYFQMLETILFDSKTLPHLELVSWAKHGNCPSRAMWSQMGSSKVQHLKVNCLKLDKKTESELYFPEMSSSWPLRTLDIDLDYLSGMSEPSSSPFFFSLLRSCASSLETLVWKSRNGCNDPQSFGSDPSMTPCFPKLRNLYLQFVSFSDPAALDALLQAPLRVLVIHNVTIARPPLSEKAELRQYREMRLNRIRDMNAVNGDNEDFEGSPVHDQTENAVSDNEGIREVGLHSTFEEIEEDVEMHDGAPEEATDAEKEDGSEQEDESGEEVGESEQEEEGESEYDTESDNEEEREHLEEVLSRTGCIRSLETFVWNNNWGPPHPRLDDLVNFLAANPHISKLSLPTPYSPLFLGKKLLPLLYISFEVLTSLHLWWDARRLPDSSLEMISRIKSLKQLHIRVQTEDAEPYKKEWIINHYSMWKYLPRLPHLQSLAFRGDLDEDLEDGVPDSFFEDREIERPDADDEEGWAQVYWDYYKMCAVPKASKYFDNIPKLEWLFMGGVHWEVREYDYVHNWKIAGPVPEHEGEESGDSFLMQVFGWEGITEPDGMVDGDHLPNMVTY